MEWIEESNQDLILTLLDFEKAYNCIIWDFLKVIFKKLGFFNSWILIVMV